MSSSLDYSVKPQPVIPENLSEMSPVAAWNSALDLIKVYADYNSFWNDGLDTSADAEMLKIKQEEKTDGKRKFRYRGAPRRLVGRSQGLYSWRFRHADLRESEAEAQLSGNTPTKLEEAALEAYRDYKGE